MKTILAITRDSLREMIKRKLILAILIAGILMALLFVLATAVIGLYAPELFQGAGSEEIKGVGYGLTGTVFSIGVDILGMLLVLLPFSTFLPTEIDRGTIKLIISKPVTRMEMVLGKFLSGAIIMSGYTVMMGILQLMANLYLTGGLDLQEIYVYLLLLFKFLMMGSVAMALSVVIRPVLSSIIAFFLSGHIFYYISLLVSSKFIAYPALALYYILPTYYSSFSEITRKLQNSPPLTVTDILYQTGYALDFIIIAVAITIILFNKKDLI